MCNPNNKICQRLSSHIESAGECTMNMTNNPCQACWSPYPVTLGNESWKRHHSESWGYLSPSPFSTGLSSHHFCGTLLCAMLPSLHDHDLWPCPFVLLKGRSWWARSMQTRGECEAKCDGIGKDAMWTWRRAHLGQTFLDISRLRTMHGRCNEIFVSRGNIMHLAYPRVSQSQVSK